MHACMSWPDAYSDATTTRNESSLLDGLLTAGPLHALPGSTKQSVHACKYVTRWPNIEIEDPHEGGICTRSPFGMHATQQEI